MNSILSNRRNICTVIVVGTRIPPLNGNSTICEYITNFLSDGTINVISANTSVRTSAWRALYVFMRAAMYFRAWIYLLLNAFCVNRSLIINVNGDFGIIFSVMTAAIGRALRYRIFLYHHSSRYTRRFSVLAWILVGIAGHRAVHILAAKEMAVDMSRFYKRAQHFLIISNSAYIDSENCTTRLSRMPLRLGFISNLSVGKGVDISFEIMRILQKQSSSNFILIVAGVVVDEPTEIIVRLAEKDLGSALEFRGSVQGERKDAFFEDIDVLLFPTTYKHETQSLVIPEAQSRAIPVIAHDHAYVKTMFNDDMSGIFKPGPEFVQNAAWQILRWFEDLDEYDRVSRATILKFKEDREKGREQLMALKKLVSDQSLLNEKMHGLHLYQ